MAIKAGKNAKILITGSALAFTTEATAAVIANTSYQIVDTAKRIWDMEYDIDVFDGGSPTIEAYTVNRLNGTITFGSATSRVITVTGKYLPTTEIGYAKDYTYTIDASNEDITSFGKTWTNRMQALLDFTCSLTQWSIDDTYQELLNSGVPIVLEFYTDDASTFDLKAWVLPSSNENSGSVDGVVEESLDFEGTTDVDFRSITLN